MIERYRRTAGGTYAETAQDVFENRRLDACDDEVGCVAPVVQRAQRREVPVPVDPALPVALPPVTIGVHGELKGDKRSERRRGDDSLPPRRGRHLVADPCPGHPDEACRGHLEQQALLADGWISLTPYLPFRPGREEAIAAQFPERREGPLLVAVIGGFGPRWDVIHRSWYVRGGRVEVRTGDLVGAIAVELTRAPDDGAYVAGNVLSWSAEAVGRTLDPDGLSITATCGSRLHRLRFAEGRLEALDHDPAELADEGRRWTAGRCGELLDLWGSGEWAATALDMTQEDSDYQRVDVKAVELLPLLQPLTAAARAHLVTAMDRYGVGTVSRVLDVALFGEDRAPSGR